MPPQPKTAARSVAEASMTALHVIHEKARRPSVPKMRSDMPQASLVHVHDAQIARQPAHEPLEARLLPVDLKVREPRDG